MHRSQSCRAPFEWPTTVAQTTGITIAASSSADCAALKTNAQALYYATGAIISCPTNQPSVMCLTDGSMTVKQCGADIVTLPPTVNGQCATATILGTTRAWYNNCPQPAPPSSGGMGWFAVTCIVLSFVLSGAIGVFLYRKHYQGVPLPWCDGTEEETEGLRSVMSTGING